MSSALGDGMRRHRGPNGPSGRGPGPLLLALFVFFPFPFPPQAHHFSSHLFVFFPRRFTHDSQAARFLH